MNNTVKNLLQSNKDRFTFSLEFIPPSKDVTRSQFLEKIQPLMECKPLFVNVTTHRNSTELVRTADGFAVYEHTKHISTLPIVIQLLRSFLP